jgi:hypothetical protein
MVRQPSGNVLTFKELTTLQKWIVERKVSREDEISKSGETWKRLGSIAELASFFQAVDVQAPAPPPAISAGYGPGFTNATVPLNPVSPSLAPMQAFVPPGFPPPGTYPYPVPGGASKPGQRFDLP